MWLLVSSGRTYNYTTLTTSKSWALTNSNNQNNFEEISKLQIDINFFYLFTIIGFLDWKQLHESSGFSLSNSLSKKYSFGIQIKTYQNVFKIKMYKLFTIWVTFSLTTLTVSNQACTASLKPTSPTFHY